MITTKEFTEKLKREIEEIGKYYTDEIVRMLRRYKYDFEEQIEDEEKYSKRMVDEYEKKLWDEVDEKKSGLKNENNDNDEDDCDTIQQLGLEVGLNVESLSLIHI